MGWTTRRWGRLTLKHLQMPQNVRPVLSSFLRPERGGWPDGRNTKRIAIHRTTGVYVPDFLVCIALLPLITGDYPANQIWRTVAHGLYEPPRLNHTINPFHPPLAPDKRPLKPHQFQLQLFDGRLSQTYSNPGQNANRQNWPCRPRNNPVRPPRQIYKITWSHRYTPQQIAEFLINNIISRQGKRPINSPMPP